MPVPHDPPRLFFVKAASKGLADGFGVKADCKELTGAFGQQWENGSDVVYTPGAIRIALKKKVLRKEQFVTI